MTPNKTKSGLFETPRKKLAAPAAPRSGKLGGRAPTRSESNPTSPLQNARAPVDRSHTNSSHNSVGRPASPRSVNSRSTAEQRLSRSPTAAARELSAKDSELQTKINVAQEDLKKLKEQLVIAEKEKSQAIEELKEAKKQAYDANERLTEALAAQKQAEERTEIERFRVVELEQASIEAAQQKEEAWEKELESIRSQHILDVSTLASTSQELERLKQELMMNIEAKNAATIHAEEALGIAEVNAEKVARLSEEITHLKLTLDSKLESKDCDTAEKILGLNLEIESLRGKLEKALEAGKKLPEMENLTKDLRNELADAKRAESDAANVAEYWKKQAAILDAKVEEAILSERSASESLAMAVKNLEECSASLHGAECEIGSLKEKVESLEIEIGRNNECVSESGHHVELVKQELVEMERAVELLKCELQTVEEEKLQALNNVNKKENDLQHLLEEKGKVVNDLEITKVEFEHSKKARDDLASALDEVTAEARESRGRVLEKQVEFNNAQEKINELECSLKSTGERYEAALGKATNEIVQLKTYIEESKMEADNLKHERSIREKELLSSLRNTEEGLTLVKGEMEKATSKLKRAELEVASATEEGIKISDKLKQAKLEASFAYDAAEEARADSLSMKERLLDKENELQCIIQENADLRNRERDALKKIEELTELLEEATFKKRGEENGVLSNIEKDYDVVSRMTEFSDGALGEFEVDKQGDECIQKSKQESVDEKGEQHLELPNKVDLNSQSVDTRFSPERDLGQETMVVEAYPKSDSESFDQKNESCSETKAGMGGSPDKDRPHKSKSPLLRKFGHFLKKKNNHNQ